MGVDRDNPVEPSIDASAWVASTAVLSGDVRVGPHARILHGAVLTADAGHISVGAFSIVMENAVLRSSRRDDLEVGHHCVVGAHANLSGCTIGDEVFLATGAAVFPGARIGDASEVRIHGVVQVDTTLEPGATVPIGWVAVGTPARILPPEQHDEIWAIQETLDFPRRVFGADRTGPHPMREITERWSASLGEPTAKPARRGGPGATPEAPAGEQTKGPAASR
jgi:carbonic anhydrase/acetyltransferase-like protein (isoleucine patch superfamily)